MESKNFLRIALLCLAGLALEVPEAAGELPLGANVEGLLEYARGNPEYAAMRHEADAAAQRSQRPLTTDRSALARGPGCAAADRLPAQAPSACCFKCTTRCGYGISMPAS